MTSTTSRSAPSSAAATAREIAQQPEVWVELAQLIQQSRGQLDAFLGELLEQPGLRIVLTGAGTSAFVGSIAAPALARSLGRRVDAIATTDIVSNPLGCFAEDVPTLLVSFARSGNSPESIAATQLADQVLTDVHHLVLTCDADGTLYRGHNGRPGSLVVLMPPRANDEGFAMTSSFTSMLLGALLVFQGGNDAAVESLALSAHKMLDSRQDAIRELAESRFDRVVYLGSGPFAGLARESALKLLELSAGTVVGYYDSALGFRHGPKAILNDRTLVVVYVSSDPYTRQYDLDILAELRVSIAPENVIAISTVAFETPNEGSWEFTDSEGLPDELAAVAFAVVAQLLALWMSVTLGITTDNPFPGGGVNRVVRGVTVHPLQRT